MDDAKEGGFTAIHPLPHSALIMSVSGRDYMAYSAMDRLWCGHRAWSDASFGTPAKRGPVGALKHLSKEALEAAENPTDVTEFADCLFLLWDAAHRAGFSMTEVVEAGFRKLQVLHTRHYPEVPDGEPAEHDRSGE
jgi:hypothetical protein